MPQTAAFDTLQYAKKLRAVGFTEEQAEVQAEALADIIVSELDTKRDLRELEYRLIIRLGGMIVVAIGIVATLVKLL
ncbi:MAG: DUF1640 domain-containing protein [Thermodesulfobacteriota bacterium]